MFKCCSFTWKITLVTIDSKYLLHLFLHLCIIMYSHNLVIALELENTVVLIVLIINASTYLAVFFYLSS